MAPEKAGGTRRRGGTGRGESEPVEPAAGSDVGTGIALIDIDPWGALEKLWEHPEEGEPADERRVERKPDTRLRHEAQVAALGSIS